MDTAAHRPRMFLRLSRSQRIQHAMLFVSTGLLIVTGFMLYTDRWIIQSFGGASEAIFWWRSFIHRAAGVVATAVCTYHLIYVVVTKEGRRWFKDMLPWYTDVIEAYQNVMFLLGFRANPPKMGRFMYLEKLEYWSVYFGMFIVIFTGIMMWTEYLWPKFYMDVAVAFHFGEATLATLAIIVGHMFAVHYGPHTYPMNKAFIDGMISEELVKHEHGRWYEEEFDEARGAEAQEATPGV